jgi:hypothetical protein
MEPSGSWLIPELSLASQCNQEIDRRQAVRLSHQDLQALADRLICDWYLQRNLIDRCLGRVRQLEVEVALAQSEPIGEPEPCHYAWAHEILGGAADPAGGAAEAG